MTKILSRFCFLSTIMISGAGFANPTINNYINGFSYDFKQGERHENIVVYKDQKMLSEPQYNLRMKLKENDYDNFQAHLSSNKKIHTKDVFSLITDSLEANIKNNEFLINYRTSLNEMINMYGMDSFLIKEMHRCKIKDLQLNIYISHNNFRITSNENHVVNLKPTELHLLSFCD